MVDARRKADQVALLDQQPYPAVALASHIEEAGTLENVSDLLILVEMLVEECLDLAVIELSHGFR